MKFIEMEELSASSVVLSDQSKSEHSSRTIPQQQTKVEKASEQFWQAIKTVIALQNQAPPLQQTSRNTDLPLSFSQERLWLLNQLKPDSSSHNIPYALRLTGALNVPALEQSLNEILRRHETLRTTFATVNEQPVQLISPAQTFTLPIVNLQELPPDQRETAALDLATQEAQRLFNLNSGPILRASLLQLGQQEYVLLVTIHQVVFDGWSEGVLFRELAALYEAFSTGKPSPLPELPIQYADFAAWQRQWLQGEFLDALLSYWQQQVGDGLPAQQLPTDRLSPVAPTRRSAHQTLVLPKQLTESLKALTRQEGATLFTTLLAAFKVLLYRYTAQENLFVCSPTANRNRSQTKGLIGYFVNLLVLRTDLSGNPTFRELLSRVRTCTSGAFAHQDLPVQQLVNSLNLVHTPLNQVMFVFRNVPKQPLKLPGLTVSSLDIENGTADFDLSLSMVEEAQELSGVFKYNTDLFDEATISQMMGDFQTLLEEIVANPEQSISSLLPLLAETQRQQLPTGKVEGSTLPLPNGERPRTCTSEYVAPREPLDLQLTQIWEEVFGIQPIGLKDNFFELGGHSLLAIRLLTQIETAFGKKLSLATLLQAPTIEQLAEIMSQEGWTASSESLVPLKLGGSKPPLFCLYGITLYYHVARNLGPDQPVYGVYLQSEVDILTEGGPEKQPLSLISVEEQASHYLKQIRTIQPTGPYFLAGLSFGGLLALEMAQQLRQEGEKVALVALFDTLVPSCTKGFPLRHRIALHWRHFLQEGSPYALKQARSLLSSSKDKLLDIVSQISSKFDSFWKERLPGYPTEADKDVRWQVRNHTMKSYVPRPYPGKAILFRAMNHESRFEEYYTDPQLWTELVTGELKVHHIPGDHIGILKEPNVQVLAAELRAYIEQAQADI